MTSRGYLSIRTVAIAPEGEPAGYSHLFAIEGDPLNAIQDDAHVLTFHRGHRLGTLLKVANLRALQRNRPQVRHWRAELQVRWHSAPIVYAETRPLGEEWTYRYLAAVHTWAETEQAVMQRIGAVPCDDTTTNTPAPAATTAEVRAWARDTGLAVADRGRLHSDIWAAWHDTHTQ